MNLHIGDNIRKMRREKGITQERLAEVLKVSCQSVSRWELNICYPDIELLPAIADYFGVTLDELMSMNDIRSESRRNAVFNDVFTHERSGDWASAINVLRDAFRIFPSDKGMRAELALALSQTGIPEDRKEAISISEDLMETCKDEKLLSTVRANLCFLYKADGQTEKAIALGKTLPHIWECREMLLPALVSGADRPAMTERSLNIAQQVLEDMFAGRHILFSLGYAPEKDTDTEKLKGIL